MRPPRALPAAHFDRNERYAYFGDRTLRSKFSEICERCRLKLFTIEELLDSAHTAILCECFPGRVDISFLGLAKMPG